MNIKDDQVSTEKLERLIKEGESILIDSEQLTISKTINKTKDNRGVLLYIKKYNIMRGTIRVPNYIIFYFYRRIFNSIEYQNKLKREGFFREFNKHFSQVRTGKQRYYLLNDCFEITEEINEKALKYMESYKRNTNGKKNKKKSSKVSCSKKRAKY